MPPTSDDHAVPSAGKRKVHDRDPSISPPPMKRAMPSAVSKNAVADFFTPVSQRPKSPVSWEERPPSDGLPTSLLVAKYKPSELKGKRRIDGKQKVAVFDLDSTLITTSSGKKHAANESDWKWWHPTVPKRLKALQEEGYALAIFSNQGGLALHPDAAAKKPKATARGDRVTEFKQKCRAVLCDLCLSITLYAATGKDRFRKPRVGMWAEMCRDLNLAESGIDHENSLFVGDAGGRVACMRNGKTVAKDFSCSDRNLATNLGIAFYTPEEFFLGEPPREFEREFDLQDHPFAGDTKIVFEKVQSQEVVVFCGPPGAGKSTFFRSCLEPLGFERVNQDTLKSKDRCLKAAAGFLTNGSSVAIDNTNPDPASRALWIDLAKKHSVPARCIYFKTNPATCEHNDAARSQNKSLNPDGRDPLPKIAFNGFFARFKEPKIEEGFASVTEVEFAFRGTKDEYELWGRYWL